MTLSSVVFRNMSSEPERPSSPKPGSAPGSSAGPAPDTAAAQAQGGEPVTLTDAKAMRAVAHPVRMALIELFSYHETLTATQASDLLGESPANCAFHLRTLAKYGFVREAGGGKGRERPWTLVNRTVRITADQPDPQAALAADELGRVFLERWIDRARRAYGASNEVPGWEKASGWTNTHIFLTPDETTRLRDEISQILDRYEGRLTNPALRPDGASPVEWTIFATPVPELAQPVEPARRPEDPGASRSTDPADPLN
jgi:predicted transcriptional regulator